MIQRVLYIKAEETEEEFASIIATLYFYPCLHAPNTAPRIQVSHHHWLSTREAPHLFEFLSALTKASL